jgi:hypothetical protein
VNTHFTFDTVEKDPAASRRVLLDFFDDCANFWEPNEQFSIGQYIRPRLATGFSYHCTQAGTSGFREPQWNRVADQVLTKLDGSIQWTCRVAELNGVNSITGVTAVSDPVGLTIDSILVVESYKISAIYSGGEVDQDFEAVFSFTLSGVPRVARQIVRIVKR